jgi:hypothetical protein
LQVIGINTAIRANAAGIGFAIPIDTAEMAMKTLSTGEPPLSLLLLVYFACCQCLPCIHSCLY